MKGRSRGVWTALGCAAVLGISGSALVSPSAHAQVRSVAPRAATTPPALPPVNTWVYGWAAVIVIESDGQERLIRVSPDGRTRDVGPVAGTSAITDVSYDARRIITQLDLGGGLTRFLVWDSTTGGRYQVTLTGTTTQLFFGPNGGLVSVSDDAAGTVVRNRYGTPIKSFPTLRGAFPDVSPGGTTLSYQSYTHSVGHSIASLLTGRVVRYAVSPQQVDCPVTGMWSDGSTKFYCVDIPGTTDTYTLSTATGVTTQRGPSGADLGQVVPTTPMVGTKYWDVRDQLLDVSGTTAKPVPLTGPWGDREVLVTLLGGRGSSAFVEVSWKSVVGSGTVTYSTLVRKSLPNGPTTVLAGSGSADGRRIMNVYVVDGLN
ncbi:hypothetical protein [Allobranchiibius sp. CTAmp26]|uniref:hypothetical protein n=1 Tax=Allobranchiibius sp. CTAmp26 TaxID=2815214 RepID=UPI001AA15702|nr:hypothetical protein [Allobranchiibius sp. CTAmp26]MBO1756841.1 hypothetical protein [Allobranchiibius sp. CTAmp26]